LLPEKSKRYREKPEFKERALVYRGLDSKPVESVLVD